MLEKYNEATDNTGISVETLIKRTNLSAMILQDELGLFENCPQDALKQININVKYDGYLVKQKSLIEKNKKLDTMPIPAETSFENLKGLRLEAIQKLNEIRPLTIGQASRISGVSPADISILIFNLNKKSH